jgi:hypothetical protein
MSSPVSYAMLEGEFAESAQHTVAFEEDDWHAWKWWRTLTMEKCVFLPLNWIWSGFCGEV